MSGSCIVASTECTSLRGSGTVHSMPCSLAGDSHAQNANGACTRVAQTTTTHPLSPYMWTTCLPPPPTELKQIASGLSLNPLGKSLL